ncbi:unnamed protein product [Mycena citricolor]|uniref:Uncharacterized protein n=1 Tax=Mycena citricolor TaxID=2018698 RepID=A0AAD2HVS3_9AGAR|nr:unnamed protein product [Mycena citricolor]
MPETSVSSPKMSSIPTLPSATMLPIFRDLRSEDAVYRPEEMSSVERAVVDRAVTPPPAPCLAPICFGVWIFALERMHQLIHQLPKMDTLVATPAGTFLALSAYDKIPQMLDDILRLLRNQAALLALLPLDILSEEDQRTADEVCTLATWLVCDTKKRLEELKA